MSRVDVPTMKCDRCKLTTQNTNEMARYLRLTNYNMGGQDDWDLCPACWRDFIAFMKEDD